MITRHYTRAALPLSSGKPGKTGMKSRRSLFGSFPQSGNQVSVRAERDFRLMLRFLRNRTLSRLNLHAWYRIMTWMRKLLLALLLLFAFEAQAQHVHYDDLSAPSISGDTRQVECPFDETAAVADTLDPAGYYPLQIGTVREYVSASGPFLSSLGRTEVVADTLIDGDLFHKVKGIWFDAEHTTIITEADTSYYYRGVVDGLLLAWSPGRGRVELAKLFHDFNTCFDIGGNENAAVVEGGYAIPFTFSSGDTLTLSATKRYIFFGIAVEVYGYGLGLLHMGGDPDQNTDLTYARIDGQEYGVRLDSLFDIRVGTEPRPFRGETSRLDAYPNPSSGLTYFKLVLARPGRTALRIYDVQGRLLATPLPETHLAAGRHGVTWQAMQVVPGVYFVQVLVEGRPVAMTKLVVTR